jgi:uncharacterized protein (DUF2126 family)
VSIHVALSHVTHYRFDREVALGPHLVRLRPAPHCRTRILSYSLAVDPAGHFLNWQQDPQANFVARLVFPQRTRELRIAVDLVAEMAVHNPFDFFLEPAAERFPFVYEPALQRDLAPYLVTLPATPRFEQFVAGIAREARPTTEFLVDLNVRLSREIRYLIRLEPGVQTPEATLSLGSGSCRDSGWLLVQVLRHLGLAARFVSGYLIQLVPDVKPLDGPAGPAADFTDLHAWCEVYLPGAGWIGLDPTSGLLAGEGHIPLAATAEPSAAAPVTGALDPCEVQFEHAMAVERVREAPRVTRPYAEADWARIEALGEQVDGELERHDVRLTMGGEPTFVSIDHPDAPEWNVAALGEQKRRLAIDLFRRMRDHHAPSALVHFGQGKWYPGEPLPRWSLNCFWRRDGEPVWGDPRLLSDETPRPGIDSGTAARLLGELAGRLGVAAERVFPAWEDPFHDEWRRMRLPCNATTEDSPAATPAGGPAGHVLPLARDPRGEAWRSERWYLRRERCYLTPGDSPLGWRLPLDSLPWVAPTDRAGAEPPDPNQAFPRLPPADALRARVAGRRPVAGGGREASRAPRPGESAAWIPRTALCAEARGGVLYVFMPPLDSLEAYLELVAAVEASAAVLGEPVVLEGYEPPRDPRLESFRITPDPGVIEVNVQPSARWRELVERTTHLYEAARQARLASEKFMIDGRHTGTGGGNHFVLGGATPGDSPFLRRPDLLRSLLGYWHDHPSLSYLFSGLFIGPTSQAPRVDEARNDSIYELELAFRQLPPVGTEVAPWLVDRLFRNLLIDVTGNTHRAEFCIDKLYSPDGAAGRLGLVELRAFEMPPHARMSLAQQLLLRALVAHFWQRPYAPPRLVRWGTELHDRFMLPYFVERDFTDVIDELRGAGFAFEARWFAPHLEFRFPPCGDFELGGMRVELRQALEPWHVMGEEGGAGGTVRYVDSSVERLQVHATGLAPDRYRVGCNGHAVPLRPTGVGGEFVGAVRYRAWQPPSALHPNIGVHAPLTFDLFDTWTGRSLGGCRHHVMHPGGRNYATLPVNAFESESRRLARFERMGHTPGRDAPVPPPAAVNPDFPFTLDLRGC